LQLGKKTAPEGCLGRRRGRPERRPAAPLL